MEINENSGCNSDGGLNTLIYQEDLEDNEQYLSHPNSNQNRQQVSMFNVASGRHSRLVVVSLALLAAVLLIVDISLGVHYNKLTDNHLTIDDTEHIENEMNKLQDTYKTAIETMKGAKKQLDSEMSRQTLTNWELQHQTKRQDKNNSTINVLLTNNADSASTDGFWIGLRYFPEEESWKWLDGTALVEGKAEQMGIGALTFKHLDKVQLTLKSNRLTKCAKAKDLPISNSAATPLLVEVNYLSNHNDIIRAKLETQAALARERTFHQELKMQLKQTKTVTDGLQRRIETLQTERTNLKANKTSLEENCGRCLPGWILLKSSCYYFSPRVSNSKKNWPDSRADCISHGGDLLVINNLEEQGEKKKEVKSRQTALISPVKMEGRGNSGSFGGTFNKLICEEDAGADEQPPYSNQEKQQVSMSMVRPESRLNHYRLLAGSLAVLAVILLALDIGLGVYYSQLTDGYRTITDINGEVVKLQASYNSAIQSRDEVKKQLDRETSEQQRTKWELDHQKRRSKDYEKQIDKIQLEFATLKSHLPMISESFLKT
ncbi:hypothetical protein F2P81_003589 [Scophthalmus maximus]|uniref:C-type lectin domain-containing protein n=1 Tax=Scophthalmus maximus TaxID=52904 RepID=A0A6A4TNT4_SCOMX|nr:hypothetical protein F2P81_003589 [Scophthalmus maximus]